MVIYNNSYHYSTTITTILLRSLRTLSISIIIMKLPQIPK